MNKNQKGSIVTVAAIIIGLAFMSGIVYLAKMRNTRAPEASYPVTGEELLKLLKDPRAQTLPPPAPATLSRIPSSYTIHYKGTATNETIVYQDGKNLRIDYLKNQALNQSRYFMSPHLSICSFKNGALIAKCFDGAPSPYYYPESDLNSLKQYNEVKFLKSLPDEQIIGVAAKCSLVTLTPPAEFGPQETEYCVHPQFSDLLLRVGSSKATELNLNSIPSDTFIMPKL